MFNPGQVIPAGYVLAITTWENDGDDYKTQYLYNFPKNHIDAALALIANYSHKVGKFGNEDFDIDSFFEMLVEDSRITPEFVQYYFGIDIPEHPFSDHLFDEMLSIAEIHQDDIMDLMQNMLGSPVQYDYDFMRVVDGVTVYFFEEEFTIPELPKPVQDYDMSWQSKTREWIFE